MLEAFAAALDYRNIANLYLAGVFTYPFGHVAMRVRALSSLEFPSGEFRSGPSRIFAMYTDTVSPEVSRHKCLIYDGDPSGQLPVVVPFLKTGLENNWRCLYLGNPESVMMVSGALCGAGTDTASEMKRGALLFSSERHHLTDGMFDARAMVDGLRELIDGAVQEGFQGLCATGDMRWELGPEKNFDLLVEYEALLEQLFREKPLIGLCQYHRAVIPARTLRDALITHRSTYIGDTLNRDNLFYMPPELLLESRDEGAALKQGEWMCQQIMRVLKAEQTRDKALVALEEMNRDLERRVKERTAELEIANQHLEAFSYSVSHDLRAPLRAITGFSDILAQESSQSLSGEERMHLERVRTNARHMGELIDGLLTLARVAKTELHRRTVDLTAMAGEVAGEIRESEPGRSARFLIHDGMRVTGDEVLLRCVLANLLGNAWKFTAKRPHAQIEVGKTQLETGATGFFVRDNGSGFEMRYADKLCCTSITSTSVVQPVSAPPYTRRFPGHGSRACYGAKNHHKAWRPHMGRESSGSRNNLLFYTVNRTF